MSKAYAYAGGSITNPVTIHKPTYLFTAETREGFLVASVDTSRGEFSITADHWPSEMAWKLGNESACFACGQLTDEIAAAFPDGLSRFLNMHLTNTETGEPTLHAIKNCRYFLDPAGNLAHILERGRNATPWTLTQDLGPDEMPAWETLADHCIGAAMRTWRCDFEQLPDWLDERHMDDAYAAMVPVWQERRDEFVAWLNEQPEPAFEPSDEPTSEWRHVFYNKLAVESKLVDTVDSPIVNGMCVFQYETTVHFGGKQHTALSTGSVADYEGGHEDARGAAFSVLRELKDIYEMGDEFWEMCEIPEDDERRIKGDAAAELFGEAITANMDIIGI